MNPESDGSSDSLSDQFYDIVDDGDDKNDSGAICPLIGNDSQGTLVCSL